MATAITSTQVTVNNTTISIVPNSFSYTEGFGEQSVTVQSAGGSSRENVYQDDISKKYSTLKWEMYPTAENISIIRSWKANADANAVSFIEPGDGSFHRYGNNAALINDYEVNLGYEKTIAVEFRSDPVT